MPDPPDKFDVAIVGGGISGLYAAWRLASQTEGPPLRVCVHELSDQLGGRLDTHTVPNSNARVELGAMRFPPSHAMVQALLGELNVATEPFPAQNFLHMFLRGTPLEMPPVGAPSGGPPQIAGVPYRLTGTEASHPYVLLVQALLRILQVPLTLGQTGFERVVAGGPSQPLTAADWDELLEQVTVDGKPLWQWGFWNLLSRVLSNEAYQYLLDGFGVESAVSNWNAFLAIRLLCTIMGDAMGNQLRHPIGGWIELVNALEQRLMQLPNCTLVKNSRLFSVEKTSQNYNGSPLQLTFWDDKFTNLPVPDPGGPDVDVLIPEFYTILAQNVILAMPPRAIELINLESLQTGVSSFLLNQMRQVLRIPAFKAYVAYAEPWWQAWCGWQSGFTVTDLPLRQVFYGIGFPAPSDPALTPPAGPTPGAERPHDGQRILMASYADASTVSFWSGLDLPGPRVREYWGTEKNENLPLREAMNRQLKELHGYEFDFPRGDWACTVDWAADPFGAGWHAWRPNVDVITQIAKMRQPLEGLLPGLKLFVCGEAFSHVQGWIEGAITSAEMLLEEQFKLTRPTWIPASYPLVPALPAKKSTSNTGD
jgi:Flavin containing amine oxidoreductase